ncbi:MAG: hypothetical protein KKC01_12960 [Gammaproteobacteria bacterium]|nr:hypothetical protein [Gammaproteobacteria bacterium]
MRNLATDKSRINTLVLIVLLCLSTVASAADRNAHFDMSGWRQYLADQLDPGLSAVNLKQHPVAGNAFDWKDAARSRLLPDFARSLLDQKQPALTSYNLNSRSAALNVWSSSGFSRPSSQLAGLQQHFYQPGFAGRLSRDGLFSIGMVFAEQQYGNALLDQRSSMASNYQRGYYERLNSINEVLASPFTNNQLLSSKGIGFAFGYSYNLLPQVELQTSYRSRIDTESAYQIIGLYADPAELDLPARIGASLNFAVSDQHTLRLGVERVQYSQVDSFISGLLPSNLLSLLGDSNSPSFIWSDLNIVTASWNYQPADSWNLGLQYSTRTQPLPQDQLLSDALRSSLSNNAYAMFASKQLSPLSNLTLGVTYAPVDISFGGSALGIISDDLSNNLEFDLRLNFSY